MRDTLRSITDEKTRFGLLLFCLACGAWAVEIWERIRRKK